VNAVKKTKLFYWGGKGKFKGREDSEKGKYQRQEDSNKCYRCE